MRWVQPSPAELRMYQAVLAATIVAVPMTSALYDWLCPSPIDPPFFRALFVALPALVLVGSLLSRGFQKFVGHAIFVTAILMTAWVAWLTAANQFTATRVLGTLLVHLCIGQLFVSARKTAMLHAVMVASLTVGAATSPPPYEVPPAIAIVIAVFIAIVGVAATHRQERLIGQLQQIRDQLEDRVEERTRELQQANLAKSQFLTNMSHELRTPLNAVLGYGELMSEDLEDSGTIQLSDLQRVLNSGRHLLAMINDVLDLAKVEAGAWALEYGRVDLGSVVDEAVATVRALTDANGNTVTTDIAPGLSEIWSDRTRLSQVLVNLLSNAAKFTENGQIRIVARRDGDELFIEVSDTGMGIPEDKLDTIFDKFVQLQDASSRRHRGTGLGLAICAEMTEAFGGRIDVRSEVGVGSTFIVRLPADKPVSTAREAA